MSVIPANTPLWIQVPSEKVFGVGARRVQLYLLRRYLDP